jgi:hypothetical protein
MEFFAIKLASHVIEKVFFCLSCSLIIFRLFFLTKILSAAFSEKIFVAIFTAQVLVQKYPNSQVRCSELFGG